MANTLLNSLKQTANVKRTENGAISLKSTMDGVMDLFALGAAYRSRSDEDVILLFEKAWREDPTYALKCLFYIRDCRGGQGERRFFRVVTRWLARSHTDAATSSTFRCLVDGTTSMSSSALRWKRMLSPSSSISLHLM